MEVYGNEVEETIKRKSKPLNDILCNKCGKSVCNKNSPYYINGVSIDVSFGYGSTRDGDEYSFDLCNQCIEDMFQSFMYQPTLTRG